MSAYFKIDYQFDPNLAPTAQVIDIEWARIAAWRTPFSASRLMECVRIFGVYGGFAGAAIKPEQSTIGMSKKNIISNGGLWHFDGVNIDSGIHAVLENVLAYSHRTTANLCRAVVRGGYQGGSLSGMPLRGCSAALPFIVDLSADGPDVCIDIEFTSTVPVRVRKAVKSTLLAWVYLTAAGAFEVEPNSSMLPLLLLSGKPQWDNQYVSLRLVEAAFDDAAFDALLNSLQSIHYRGSSVASVTIS